MGNRDIGTTTFIVTVAPRSRRGVTVASTTDEAEAHRARR
jgi:hypothetical protein